MFKTIPIIVMAALCLNFNSRAQSQKTLPLPEKQAILGKVVSATTGEALPGAVIKIMTPNHTTVSNDKGEFILTLSNGTYNISISHLSYKTKNISIQIPLKKQLIITLETDDKNLQEVEIVSTGYQNIPKERVTGSFSQPDKKMFEARVSTNVISKLEGITNGLVFNTIGATGNNHPLTIRGRSTIFSNTQPLIVIDNFPYDGDISNINPNDVENVTILKDAAAASIWGARSSNGVIIITTKKGKLNQDFKISLNSNITVSSKPDLFYDPNTLTSTDLIDLEKELFSNGFYAGKIADGNKPAISPVVALLEKGRLGSIVADEVNLKIEQMRVLDVRNDLLRYLYRNSLNQQYAINFSGGSNKNAYYLSAGYDKNLLTKKANDNDRITINFENDFKITSKLNITLGINYVQRRSKTDNTLSSVKIGINALPYTILSDANEHPLTIGSSYSSLFTETIQNKGFLNWEFNPLNELNGAYNTINNKSNDIRLSTRFNYTIISGLKASLIYQFQRSSSFNKNLFREESYYTRDLINRYSIVNTSGQVTDYNIPFGSILGRRSNINTSNNTRAQVEYNKKIDKHELNIIVGFETREAIGENESSTLYGYDEDTGVFGNVNSKDLFKLNPQGFGIIGNGLDAGGSIDRFRSYFGNAAYTFKGKYTLTASARIDQSNLFGVRANQKGVPLWSLGTKWDVNKEKFYDVKWLPILNIRVAYGYNGNINKSLTAITTFRIAGGDATGLTNQTTAAISNYGNPDLTWEKNGVFNIGVDFGMKNNIIFGSLEYFRKNGKNLIGERLLPQTSGITSLRGNYAATKGEGWDLQINSRNFSNSSFSWGTLFLLSNATDKVKEYSVPTLPSQLLGDGRFLSTYIGKPVNSIFSTKWAGLNPNTGAPRGYDIDGNISESYPALVSPKTFEELVYAGPSRPTIFGGLRNTVNYKSVSLSFNLSYKLGYYFRRKSINYNNLYNSYQGNQDYSLRWKIPGDELITNIPSAVSSTNPNRDNFFALSDILVEKADHIRFQDISLAYSFNSRLLNSINFNSIQVYCYINNMGILWKSTDTNIDPDFPSGGIIDPKTISFGVKTSF